MDLSIICPAYNEIHFIEALLKRLCAPEGIEKEILLTDGGSTDGTREKVLQLCKEYPSLKLVDNPLKTSTHAFNIAYRQAKGKYVAFVGAHAAYNENYFRIAIDCLDKNECDVVGGPLNQKGKSDTGKAIALVMSSKAGVGNTEFRTMKTRQFVDSVAFAVYRKSIFEKAGLMDESLPVNQDDELHYRLNGMGYRILMVPEMQATYYVRGSYRKLARQYFRYGFYKPAVIRKIKGAVRLRHLVPSLLVLYFVSLPLTLLTAYYFIPLLLYLMMILITTLNFDASAGIKLKAIPVFPVLHVAYGSGFIAGFFKR